MLQVETTCGRLMPWRMVDVVDGIVAANLGLAGKPAPDGYLLGAHRLGSDPARTVVVEDATSGVAAGAAGSFAVVIGVDQTGGLQKLQAAAAGADWPWRIVEK